MNPDSILARMDAALAKAEVRRLEPSAFYLTDEDWDRFNVELSADWGSPCWGHSWRKVQIRPGQASKLYTWHGTGICIPKRAAPVDRRRQRRERRKAAQEAQQPVEKRRRA